MSEDKLTNEEAQEIVLWAVQAAGMAYTLSYAADVEDGIIDLKAKVDALEYGIDQMISHMPEKLHIVGRQIADDIADEIEKEEAIVEEFMDDVDKYL